MPTERIQDLTQAPAGWLTVPITRTLVVGSSNVGGYGYDAGTQTLEIAFNNGGIYRYALVPESVYADLEAAGSKGSFVYHSVRERFETVCLVRGHSAANR